MARRLVTLDQLPAALESTSKAVPGYFERVGGAGMESLDPEDLVRRFLTGTLGASETPWEGTPEGRGLDYRSGHSRVSDAERDAVNRAAGAFGVRGSANDARHNGTAYGIFIERRDHDHEKAHDRMLGILSAAAPEAWRESLREAGG